MGGRCLYGCFFKCHVKIRTSAPPRTGIQLLYPVYFPPQRELRTCLARWTFTRIWYINNQCKPGTCTLRDWRVVRMRICNTEQGEKQKKITIAICLNLL